MLPVLISIGQIKIYTFGVFLVLAFFWGSFLLWRLIRLTAYKEEIVFDGLFIALAIGLFFARLFYVIPHFSEFGFSFLKFILINGYPGLSLYGALIGAFLAFYFYSLPKKIKFFHIGDYFISPLFLSLAIGFLGRFFASETRNVVLLQSVFFFLLSLISYRLLMKIRQEKLFSGFNFIFFLNTFSLTMLIDEKSSLQILLLLLFLTTLLFFLYYFRTQLIEMIIKFFKKTSHNVNKIFKKTDKRDRNTTATKKGRD
jgi:prolipoprotein diacylglyceryltransferase